MVCSFLLPSPGRQSPHLGTGSQETMVDVLLSTSSANLANSFLEPTQLQKECEPGVKDPPFLAVSVTQTPRPVQAPTQALTDITLLQNGQ